MNGLKNGYLIIYVMVLTFITMSIGLSVLTVSGTQYTHVVDDVYRQDATYGAKACASVVAERLNDNSDFSGFSNQVIFDNLTSSQGQVTCSATVSNGASGAKNVNVTTTMRRFAADPYPVEYKLRAVLKSSSSSTSADYLKGGILAGHAGFYTMLIGDIKTPQLNVVGKLYSSFNFGDSLGTSSSPIGKITVGNVACGDTTNWPQPCSDQPVMQWVYSLSDIYADTCAPGQTTNLTKFKGVGLSTDCKVIKEMPGFDKASFTSNKTNIINVSTLLNTGAGGCIDKVAIIPGYPQYGVQYFGRQVHIPANTKIVGNLENYFDGATNITSSNALKSFCTLVFDGDAYITGNITPTVFMDISDTASKNATVVVNGTVRMTRDHPDILPSSSGKLLHVISFYSSSPTCSNSDVLPSASVKTCLTNSQALQSVVINVNAVPQNPAIVFQDVTSSGFNFPGLTLYSYYGTVHTGCTFSTLAALGGQGVAGGCASVGIQSNINIVGNNPTFGDLISSASSDYKVVDVARL